MQAVTVHFFDEDGVIHAVRGYENQEQAQEDIDNLDSKYGFVVLEDIETNAH